MSEITKPIMLDETGQNIATSLATIATQNRDIYSAATQAAASATAAQGSASNAEDEATAAAASAAAAAHKLDDLETFLGGLDPESAASVAAELGLFEQEVASDYAKKDGYYEQMGVGTADNLAGHGSVNAEYTFRTSGGDSDIGTGAAAIDTVKGNTLVWNQLVDANTTSVDTVSGHKYLTNISGVKSIITSNGTPLSVTGGTDCVHDLTKMFGSGYEPSTVAEFEARYPLDYYAYNAGTLINNSASGIKTIGFNAYNPSTGRVVVIKGHQYQITGTYTAIAYSDGTTITPDSNGLFTPTLNDELIVTGGNSTDTCVHLAWSGYRNGEYEPYQENIVYFDSALGANGGLTTIKGKLLVDGQPTGESVEVFENGMKSAGTAYDEAKGTTANKVLSDNIILSNIAWQVDSNGLAYSPRMTNLKEGVVNSKANFITTAPYTPVVTPQYHSEMRDNEISISVDNRIFIHDTSCTTREQLNTKLANAVLCAELATPETYLLDDPLPVNYVVNDFGTEQRLPADTSSSVMAPILYSVQYAMNATDTIRRLPINYISKDSFENFCASLASAIGPYLNPPATIAVTPTYNDNTQEYDYQVTITPTENNG